jgi:hypothetical protein
MFGFSRCGRNATQLFVSVSALAGNPRSGVHATIRA